MKRFTLCFLALPFCAFATESSLEPVSQIEREETINFPAFDVQKALSYLESLHSYLQSLGGCDLYAEMKEKSEEESKVIQEKLSALLAPISQNIESKPGWCGGFGSIGLQGFYLCLNDLLKDLATIKEEKVIATKILGFFKYLGCKEEIVLLFPQEDLK
jgi:hypothetical protein